jgi:hypothetical protein
VVVERKWWLGERMRRDRVELSGEKEVPKQFMDPDFTPLFYVTQPTANVICSTVLRHSRLSRLLQRSHGSTLLGVDSFLSFFAAKTLNI